MKTPAERKRDERDRYRVRGLVRYGRWVKPELVEILDKFLKSTNDESVIT